MLKTPKTRKELIQEYFESVYAIGRAMRGRGSEMLKKSGLSMPQSQVMFMLSEKGGLSIKEISKAVNITSSAATQLVESLVTRHYVQRVRNPEDRRVVNVALSPDGIRHFKKFKEYHLSFVSSLLEQLNDKELKFLIDITKKIVFKIDKQ